MIVKILNKTSSFNAVQYNTNKIKEGRGELMCHKNFPFLGENPQPKDIRNYLKCVSKTNDRIKNPQFHTTISAKGDEYSKEQLTDIGIEYMNKMGYKKQPYIIVFHSDTDNNHIHIVSTRVTIDGKKIDHNFENVRSQKYLKEILKEKYGIDEEQKLKDLLKYRVSSEVQLKMLLDSQGFTLINKNDKYKVYQRGVWISDIKLKTQDYDRVRAKELENIFKYYSMAFNTEIHRNDRNIWSCEMLEKLKEDKGIDVIFHETKQGDKIFGYSIIDNENRNVFKGSEVFNLRNFKLPGVNSTNELKVNDTVKPIYENIDKDSHEENTIYSDNNIERYKGQSLFTELINIASSGTASNDRDEELKDQTKKRKRNRNR